MKQSLSYKVYIPLLLATIALSFSAYAFAQETTDTNATPTDRAERSEAREEKRVALKKEFQDRMVNLAQNVTKRLTFTADRMANISLRIEMRIGKLRTDGVDTSAVEKKLFEAKGNLQIARDLIASFGSVQEAVGSETPRTSFAVIRAQFTEAKLALQKTRGLLSETIALLKEASKTNTINAASAQ